MTSVVEERVQDLN